MITMRRKSRVAKLEEKLTKSQSLFKKRYIKVHEYSGDTYNFAKNLMKEGNDKMIKYMRETWSHHPSELPTIGLPPTPNCKPERCHYKGYEYVIIHTDFRTILVFEEEPQRTVSPMPLFDEPSGSV